VTGHHQVRRVTQMERRRKVRKLILLSPVEKIGPTRNAIAKTFELLYLIADDPQTFQLDDNVNLFELQLDFDDNLLIACSKNDYLVILSLVMFTLDRYEKNLGDEAALRQLPFWRGKGRLEDGGVFSTDEFDQEILSVLNAGTTGC
jgi:hypothetical protein